MGWLKRLLGLEFDDPPHIVVQRSIGPHVDPRRAPDAMSDSEDQQMVAKLTELAQYYASGGLSEDNPTLVDEAMRIGRQLNDRGGKPEMLRIFHMIPAMQGKRTVEMTWDGIGDWRG